MFMCSHRHKTVFLIEASFLVVCSSCIVSDTFLCMAISEEESRHLVFRFGRTVFSLDNNLTHCHEHASGPCTDGSCQRSRQGASLSRFMRKYIPNIDYFVLSGQVKSPDSCSLKIRLHMFSSCGRIQADITDRLIVLPWEKQKESQDGNKGKLVHRHVCWCSLSAARMAILLHRQTEIRKGIEKEKKAPAPMYHQETKSLKPVSRSWGLYMVHFFSLAKEVHSPDGQGGTKVMNISHILLRRSCFSNNQLSFWIPGMWVVPDETLERRERKTVNVLSPPSPGGHWHTESHSSFPSLEPPAATPEDGKETRSLFGGWGAGTHLR